MPTDPLDQPFDTIESAQEFMNVLALTILDVKKELSMARKEALQEHADRRVQALDIADLKLKALGAYVHKSRRALNDLRTLRRLILNERLTVEAAMAAM